MQDVRYMSQDGNCRYEGLLTLLFICLHNLVPGACTALQASKHPFFCAPCKSVSDFCCIEIAYRRCLVKVSWQALHFCRCCSLYRLQTFSPVRWDVLPDTLHGYTRCGGRAAKNPTARGGDLADLHACKGWHGLPTIQQACHIEYR